MVDIFRFTTLIAIRAPLPFLPDQITFFSVSLILYFSGSPTVSI
jgi:hypothetical protein